MIITEKMQGLFGLTAKREKQRLPPFLPDKYLPLPFIYGRLIQELI
jgi:hypothetical protein